MVCDYKSSNQWADYWRKEVGLNVFPADTRNKRTYEEWKRWQNTEISEEQHEEWKKTNAFSNGMAIIAGKVWHRKDLKDHHFCFIDLDNQKAIEEVCKIFGAKDIKELSQITTVEQHLDNDSKAHVFFYTQYILKKKSSDATRNLKDRLDRNEIPAIEVKCQSDGIAYCTPSPHKDGSNYEIIGTKKIGVFDGKEIEDMLYEVYRKNGLLVGDSKSSDVTKMSIDDLFKPGFTIKKGHNRSEAVMRVFESLYARHGSKKSLESIRQETYDWMIEHCEEPLDPDKFERQLKNGRNFVDRTQITNQQAILLQEQDQNVHQLKTDPQIIYKIVSNVNNISKAYYIDEKTSQICYGVLKDYGINMENCIINLAPKKISYYRNPLFPTAEPKVELEYVDSKGVGTIGPCTSLSELLKILEIRGYVLNRNKAADAFNSVISAMKDKEDGMVEYLDDVTTSGYYLIDGKLLNKGISQKTEEIQKEEAIECCNLLDNLATRWKNKDVFPTVLKWGLLSPFSFIIKSNTEDWMPWLQMFGQGKSGKTTLGTLVSMIWNRSTKLKKGFSNIDTIPRLGETISKDTYPVLVNEVGSLYETGKYRKYTSIVETIKHAVESMTVRGKFVEQNRYEEIPALSPLILTSNYGPLNDGGFGRRFIPIHFSKDEKKEDDEKVKFDKLLQEKSQYLKVLGDFTMQRIVRDPHVLLKEDWKGVAKKILIEFYQYADKEVPKWIGYFIEQRDAIDESNEKTMFALRAFLVDRINSAYSRNCSNFSIFTRLEDKLKYCLNNNLIPFLHKLDCKRGQVCVTIAITHDILDEISKSWTKIENITALKDIGLQLGFNYDGKYISGKKTKVVFGSISKLMEFIDPQILSEDCSK